MAVMQGLLLSTLLTAAYAYRLGDDVGVEDFKVNAFSNYTRIATGGGFCPPGPDGKHHPHGIATMSLLLRYPSGWVSSYDQVVELLHANIQDIAEKMVHLVAIPQFEVPVTCQGTKFTLWKSSSSRINILTVRVCGFHDPNAFCQCTLKVDPAKGLLTRLTLELCKKGVQSVDTALQYAPDYTTLLETHVSPRIQRAIAKAAMSVGLFKDDDGTQQDIIATVFHKGDTLDPEWSDAQKEEWACKMAEEEIGLGEDEETRGTTKKEKEWEESQAALHQAAMEQKDMTPEAAVAQQQAASAIKSAYCQSQEHVDMLVAARRSLYGIFAKYADNFESSLRHLGLWS
eukprot:TRINITY_DN10480_c0_g1_i1.p1 TRINITY_DN10480_c0_g1~~TRINITY_DN10480_c0_g1_i1.p1  ORF type:complete len:343 (-),score=72.93 TRINITY_DN10480_c0_g1_i1:115-1143(-)